MLNELRHPFGGENHEKPLLRSAISMHVDVRRSFGSAFRRSRFLSRKNFFWQRAGFVGSIQEIAEQAGAHGISPKRALEPALRDNEDIAW